MRHLLVLIILIAMLACTSSAKPQQSNALLSIPSPVNPTATAVLSPTAGSSSTATATFVPTLTPTYTPTSVPPTPTPIRLAISTPTSIPQAPAVAPPSNTTCSVQTPISNPWCYNFTTGNYIYNPPSGFCSYFNCIV